MSATQLDPPQDGSLASAAIDMIEQLRQECYDKGRADERAERGGEATAKRDYDVFLKAWAATGRRYGRDELEGVHLGWQMRGEYMDHAAAAVMGYLTSQIGGALLAPGANSITIDKAELRRINMTRDAHIWRSAALRSLMGGPLNMRDAQEALKVIDDGFREKIDAADAVVGAPIAHTTVQK